MAFDIRPSIRGAALVLAFCAYAGCAGGVSSDSEKNTTAETLLTAAVFVSSVWEKVDPAVAYPGFTYLGLSPGCSACPAETDPDTGTIRAFDPRFNFFVRRGRADSLLVVFMGGGACWNITNCVYNHTYYEETGFSLMSLGGLSLGLAAGKGYGGIINIADERNPFRDWTIVFVPYCTADLGAGAVDREYADTYGGGDPVTIRHRGSVNFQVVLKWMKDHLPAPGRMFVTGTSAGSYAAIINFPYLREAFPDATAFVLGDAGSGVTGIDGDGVSFLVTAANTWNASLPPQVAGFSGHELYDFTLKEMYEQIAVEYPDVRFAQYTTKWDRIQAWFYDIQTGTNINFPDTWGDESDANPSNAVYQDWSTRMTDLIGVTADNYRYYLAAGNDHTIIMKTKFYEEQSTGTPFLDWVRAFMDDGAPMPDSEECTDCQNPPGL